MVGGKISVKTTTRENTFDFFQANAQSHRRELTLEAGRPWLLVNVQIMTKILYFDFCQVVTVEAR